MIIPIFKGITMTCWNWVVVQSSNSLFQFLKLEKINLTFWNKSFKNLSVQAKLKRIVWTKTLNPRSPPSGFPFFAILFFLKNNKLLFRVYYITIWQISQLNLTKL